MAVSSGRALHYVFKIGDRGKSFDFYVNKLGLKVLRHEEFEEGCEAYCNGPYNGKWSKTMVGYGEESKNFVFELTYNYEIGEYTRGNDFGGIYIASKSLFAKLSQDEQVHMIHPNKLKINDPDGNTFFITNQNKEPSVYQVELKTCDRHGTTKFWFNLIGARLICGGEEISCAKFSFGEGQAVLKVSDLDEGVHLHRASAYGRIAFACPTADLKPIEEAARRCNPKFVMKPFVALETPGKATVCVVILQDPNGHEICFVGEEAFSQLSITDPNAEQLLLEAIKKDNSSEWFKDAGRFKQII
uniref:Glyoxalase domain-containing protein 4 n=1 Tax=Rhabditophanes sp. KR3021 TaxID=114890 RepID=A0AC35UBG6_9BILA